MKKFYRNALEAAGYPEGSEKYQQINRYFNRTRQKYKRDRRLKKKLGITFNRMSAFQDQDDAEFDRFCSEEDVEEEVLHAIEMERFHKCLCELPEDDRLFLLRLYGKDKGALAEIEKETGIAHSTLIYRRNKLLKILRMKMFPEEK